jgi:hypothetical protein
MMPHYRCHVTKTNTLLAGTAAVILALTGRGPPLHKTGGSGAIETSKVNSV